MRPRSLSSVLSDLMDRSIYIWETQSAILPTLWTIGRKFAAYCQPDNGDGLNLSLEGRMSLHSIVARATDALYMGSVDEVFIHERQPHEPPPDAGDLALLAETDPTVHTAISIEGYNLNTDEHQLHIARFSLDDVGQTRWRREAIDDYEPDLPSTLKMSAQMVSQIADPPVGNDQILNAVKWLGQDLGWSIHIAAS